MVSPAEAARIHAEEARALLTRLAKVRPFALHMPMVAAAVSPKAQTAIDRYLARKRHELRKLVDRYLRWLHSIDGRRVPPKETRRRFAFLKLRFNSVLAQLDIFADVLTQRSEHEIGVWLAGLDVVPTDALMLPGRFYRLPPVICYLDRGMGAAIRRARTRLPGGGENPVAIIRVPRERMIGSGIASSLVHEVGHQAAALLDLVNSLRQAVQRTQTQFDKEGEIWMLWGRWISEIIADFWSVAKVGVAATQGLMGVVSLPRPFVFRVNLDDPHPIPWIRVKLSCAIGRVLYPHPQWDKLDELWEAYYPLAGLSSQKKRLFHRLEVSLPKFVNVLVNHRPKALQGQSLRQALAVNQRQPARLVVKYRDWRKHPVKMRAASPSLVFAVLAQARFDGRLAPEAESPILENLLKFWALKREIGPVINYLPQFL